MGQPSSGEKALPSESVMTEQPIEQLAIRVAEVLLEAGGEPAARRIVDARGVAETYGVSRDFVYAHADELGAIRLGSGPRARLRFDLVEVAARLNARRSVPTRPRHAPTRPRPRRRVAPEHLIPYDGM
jgi:hypothetical protein